jgi:hypothetical protein
MDKPIYEQITQKKRSIQALEQDLNYAKQVAYVAKRVWEKAKIDEEISRITLPSEQREKTRAIEKMEEAAAHLSKCEWQLAKTCESQKENVELLVQEAKQTLQQAMQKASEKCSAYTLAEKAGQEMACALQTAEANMRNHQRNITEKTEQLIQEKAALAQLEQVATQLSDESNTPKWGCRF